MLGSNKNITELKKDIQRIERNLSKRAKNIEGRGELAFQYLPQKLKELKGEYSKPLKDMSQSELRSYYRQLVNIGENKSSTVKGAIQAQESFGYVASKLPNLTAEQKSRLFRLYGKIYEQFTEISKDFKYELLDVAVDTVEIYGERGSEDILEQLLYEFEDLELERGEYADEEYRGKLLQIIDRLRKFYL